MKQNYIQEAYDSTKKFNEIAGNLTDVDWKKIDHQASLIFEELTETIDGIEAGDKVGTLDGACDLFVTVAGLMQKLEAQGYDVKRALQRVTDNNLSKFPQTISDEGFEYAHQKGWKIILSAKDSRFILKDENGKIRKPLEYTQVVLNDLVPKRGE